MEDAAAVLAAQLRWLAQIGQFHTGMRQRKRFGQSRFGNAFHDVIWRMCSVSVTAHVPLGFGQNVVTLPAGPAF
ncbi:Uncharacterised protein [Mycobacteroides abscessus subsp. abscessus]|nr:Uncharacterised protein [Mycobacteroides abscessus subsp. abscessus]SID23183.1 Uncharacterised protein [Mycobacteroides abscessus subsp. abscessus]